MMQGIRGERIFYEGKFQSGTLLWENGRIVGLRCGEVKGASVTDAGSSPVIPGFIDLHVHGGGGYDFTEGSASEILAAVRFHLAHGTTAIYPTVTASSKEATLRALGAIEQAMQSCDRIVGAHLEGPYLSPAQSGAQVGSILRAPDPDEYLPILDRFGEVVRRWSYAPERDPSGEFCRAIVSRGIVPSAGHTDATLAEFRAAMSCGCRQITHLYSCTSTIRREGGFRILGVLEAAYLEDSVSVEAIADGCHLPPDLLYMIYKLKGASRMALITDALRLAGTDETESHVGGTAFIIEDGVCKLPDRSAFAGSIATADRLLSVAVRAGIPLEDSIRMLTETPAAMMGIRRGRLAEGFPADLLILADDLSPKAVIAGGKTEF